MRLEAVWAGAKNHQRQRHQPGLEGVAIIHIWAYSPPMNCTERLISESSPELAMIETLVPQTMLDSLQEILLATHAFLIMWAHVLGILQ